MYYHVSDGEPLNINVGAAGAGSFSRNDMGNQPTRDGGDTTVSIGDNLTIVAGGGKSSSQTKAGSGGVASISGSDAIESNFAGFTGGVGGATKINGGDSGTVNASTLPHQATPGSGGVPTSNK